VQLGAIISIIIAGLLSMSNSPNLQCSFKNFMLMGIGGLVSAMGLTFIAFEGYEIKIQTGE
jgi:APA family basic amino acid/polyamine antiporter